MIVIAASKLAFFETKSILHLHLAAITNQRNALVAIYYDSTFIKLTIID